jgi:hypothetical protein
MITTHPAPSSFGKGLAVFVPAHWTLPQNPLKRVMRAGSLGEIVAGITTLPENPIVAEILAEQKMAAEASKRPPVGFSGCGCAPCEVGLTGLGSSVDDILKDVTSGGWQTWALALAGIGALILFTGGGGAQRHSELAAARAQYKAKVAQIRASRPRRYQKFV